MLGKRRTRSRSISAARLLSTAPRSRPVVALTEEDEGDGDSVAEAAGDDHDDDDEVAAVDGSDSETADEKRVRLTQLYLHNVRQGRTGRTAQEGRGSGSGSGVRRTTGGGDGDVEGSGSEDELADEEDVIGHRLQVDVASQSGRRHTESLAFLVPRSHHSVRSLRGHRLSVTCTALSHDDTAAYSGSKDGSIAQWDVERGVRLAVWSGSGQSAHSAPPAATTAAATQRRHGVLALSASSDGRLLASAGQDGAIRVWDIRSSQPPLHSHTATASAHSNNTDSATASLPPPSHSSTGRSARPALPPPLWCEWLSAHRSTVSALSFRVGSCELFSASHDRTVKLFDAGSKSYIETLFGHTAEVQDVHCLYRNRAVSVASDRTARLWKVVDESQLLFRVDSSSAASAADASSPLSLDCCRMLDDDHFLTGGDNGSVVLWNINKKKPLYALNSAHDGRAW